MMRENKQMVRTFSDYSAVFDSVGQKFLGTALGEPNAKPGNFPLDLLQQRNSKNQSQRH